MAASAVALSCNKSSVEPEKPQGPAIEFSTKDNWTKATDEAALKAIQTNGFRVWGWFEGTTSGHMFFTNATNDGTHVTYTNGNWTYQPPRHWMNGIYNFVAVYPQDTPDVVYEPETSGDKPVLVVDFDSASQKDLMVAAKNKWDTDGDDEEDSFIDGGNLPENPQIGLKFKHVLTKVNILIAQDLDEDKENDYHITKVTIKGVQSKGAYVLSESSTFWNLENNSEANFVKEFTSPVKLKDANGQSQPLLVWDDGLLLIPQDIPVDAISIRIDYKYQLKNQELDLAKDRYIERYFAADPDLWKSGYKVTHTITFAEPTNITFSAPTIEPWGTPQTGGTVIIK